MAQSSAQNDVVMHTFRSALLCGTLLGLLLGTAQASRRPGASRALRLDFAATPAVSAVTHVALRTEAVNSAQNSLFLIFTREANGTRNLWQATPGEAETDWTRIAAESPTWQTTPLTSLSAPFWADEAVPGSGRSLFCVTNATGPGAGGAVSQVARFDPSTGGFTPLTNERAKHRELALSPDGTKLVFVREIGGVETICILPSTGGAARRVLDGARHPVWLDNDTLLVSGARSGLSGLYRVALPSDWNRLRPEALRPAPLFPRAGEVAVAPDRSQLCLAPDDKENGDARLILLAADGSNARAVQGTEGARAPRYAPDGATLLFDAPVGAARPLWMMPLLKIAPTVQILAAHALPVTVATNAVPGVEVIGTVFAPEIATPQVRLEVGRGAEPAQWEALAPPRPPLNRERIGVWTPPPGARGEWTLRLSASGAEGESAQTTLTITLPLPPASADNVFEPIVTSQTSIKLTPPGYGGLHTAPPRTTSRPESTKIRTLPSGVKVFPDVGRPPAGSTAPPTANVAVGAALLPVVPPIMPPSASAISPGTPAQPATASTQALASTNPPRVPEKAPEKVALPNPASLTGPLPPLPPPPGSVARPVAPPVEIEPVPGILDGAPVRFDNPPETTPPVAPPVSVPLRLPPPPANPPANPPAVTSLPPVRSSSTPPRAAVVEKNNPPRETVRVPQSAATSGKKSGAPLAVSGTPAVMGVGENAPVSVSARNTSGRSWDISGTAPVRLLVRWYDVNSGTRTQYRIEWLRATVPPGSNARLDVLLKAPSRTGRFRVSFSLVKLPNGQYQPPPATSDAMKSSGADSAEELAETTFTVTVQ